MREGGISKKKICMQSVLNVVHPSKMIAHLVRSSKTSRASNMGWGRGHLYMKKIKIIKAVFQDLGMHVHISSGVQEHAQLGEKKCLWS